MKRELHFVSVFIYSICVSGDIFEMLVLRVEKWLVRWVEWFAVNGRS